MTLARSKSLQPAGQPEALAIVALIAMGGLVSGCEPVSLTLNANVTTTPSPTPSPSPTGAPTLGAASFSATVDRAYGWTNSSSAALSFAITPSATAGAKYECRSGPKALFTGGTPPAWVWCDGASGTTATHYPVVDVTTPSGTYRSEVRYTLGGSTGTSATLDYYVHTSLNGVATCPARGTDAAADAAARSALGSITGTFAGSSVTANPLITLNFDASANYAGYSTSAQTLSLRRKFTLSADRKTLIVRRVYTSRLGSTTLNPSGCSNLFGENSDIRVYDPTLGFHAVGYQKADCAALVVSADGRAVCLSWNGSSYSAAFTNPKGVSLLHNFRSSTASSLQPPVPLSKGEGNFFSRKTRVPAQATGKSLYIPD